MIPERLQKPMPKAPRLHWGWVLALQLLTRGLFSVIWLIVQANWVRRVNGTSRAFVLSIVNACALPAFVLLIAIEALVKAGQTAIGIITACGVVGILILSIWTTFQLRYELESDPIGIPLGGVATLFLGVIYFQYHLHDYDVEEKTIPEGSLGLAG
jgi:hypothetical protein